MPHEQATTGRWMIGIVEDDPVGGALVSAWLQQAGFGTRLFASERQFRRENGVDTIDCLLLDWNLPGINGYDLLRSLRENGGARLPVIFLTGHDAEAEIVAGLAAGADDYLVKPARAGELVARVRAVLRRNAPANAALTETAPYRFELATRSVDIDGRPVALVGREFDLAVYLFQRAGRLVSREALLTQVWNVGPGVTSRSIDTYVSRLRKKLALQGQHGWRLDGVYLHGYRLSRVAVTAPACTP
jgi:DNA-binding response OmpR family regulator